MNPRISYLIVIFENEPFLVQNKVIPVEKDSISFFTASLYSGLIRYVKYSFSNFSDDVKKMMAIQKWQDETENMMNSIVYLY